MTEIRGKIDGQHGPPLDDFFEAMADRHRRHVLYYFREHDEDVASTADLVSFLLEHDSDRPERETVATRLHHVTLPKLADCGLLEYDPRSETVRYRDDHRFEDCIDHSAWTEFQST
ncbi:hypothetical protein OB955_18660 [Halobacteria archaeon AArc-m2/3/4]|uniref:DUF7344 domain-containing protein n=1 Tax=Natronoglomus mannanivorans TaxID=2979990 RepID=A0AAP3E2Q6_9EURY|nr:hypothetical protein [Halobacteria archaeon AArc-xg1-1]MCU4974745.1 hypothetical protein [Halobacteria archaeon AArc-m2/3/4]